MLVLKSGLYDFFGGTPSLGHPHMSHVFFSNTCLPMPDQAIRPFFGFVCQREEADMSQLGDLKNQSHHDPKMLR